ncbi:MAG TPA: ABC transporter ATP-binding protein [Gaiellaceae bacterium]|nr:ABC transporter ATP-binding protein [Gaiellaceae bacterium]
MAIAAEELGIHYDLRLARPRSLREAASHMVRLRSGSDRREFWALESVSFTVERGDALGIIGRNGSGKSTLMLALAGILLPDTGSLTVAGRVSALLTLGAGFEPELTGRQNIYLNGAYLGLPHETVRALEPRIAEFSDLGEFIDAEVRTYSSGMRARLGFAIAAQVEPEILLLDEVLGVGDAAFQRKCDARMKELMTHASTIVVVTHNHTFVRETCTRALWLDGGLVAAFGDPGETVDAYEAALGEAGARVRQPRASQTLTRVRAR